MDIDPDPVAATTEQDTHSNQGPNDSPPSYTPTSSVEELKDLIQWITDQKQRIELEIKTLYERGEDTEPLIKFWQVLVKQIKSLEVDLVVESTEAMSISRTP